MSELLPGTLTRSPSTGFMIILLCSRGLGFSAQVGEGPRVCGYAFTVFDRKELVKWKPYP